MSREIISTTHSREEKSVDGNDTIDATPHVIAKEVAAHNDTECSILEGYYGELNSGKIIDITLQDLLAIIPRTRKRSDAYLGLRAKLRRMGVTLNIVSKKTN